MHVSSRLAGGLLLISGLSGCVTLRGGPVPLADTGADCVASTRSQSALSVRPERECTTISWISSDDVALKKQRNHVVTTRMYLLDQRYNDFERDLLNESRKSNFGTTLAQLALGTAGTLAGSKQATKALSAINTAVTGAKQGFDRDIMIDRTLQVLATQMRASRAKQKEIILKRLPVDYGEWPVGLALADLLAYESAGTLNAALTAVAESATTEKVVNEDAAEQAIRTVAYDDSAAAEALQLYLSVDDETVEAARRTKVQTAMTAAGVPIAIDPVSFIYGQDSRKREVLIAIMAAERGDSAVVVALAKGL